VEDLCKLFGADELERFAEKSTVANICVEVGSIHRAEEPAYLLRRYAEHCKGKVWILWR
jgi:hypothetical protein